MLSFLILPWRGIYFLWFQVSISITNIIRQGIDLWLEGRKNRNFTLLQWPYFTYKVRRLVQFMSTQADIKNTILNQTCSHQNTHFKVSKFSINQYFRFLIENKVPLVDVESVIGNTPAPRHSISENIWEMSRVFKNLLCPSNPICYSCKEKKITLCAQSWEFLFFTLYVSWGIVYALFCYQAK